jgi:hypothetical protein
MSDGINTAMNGVKTAGGGASANAARREPCGAELCGGQHTVLVRGNACDPGVGPAFVPFLPNTGNKGTAAPISPPFIAGVRPFDPPNHGCV